MKRDYLFIFGLLLLVILEAIIFIVSMEISISDRIQAGSIVALVFVTFYYAIQTRRLVEETGKQRKVEYAEKRIALFINVLLEDFEGVRNWINQLPEQLPPDHVEKTRWGEGITEWLLWKIAKVKPEVFERGYMANDLLREQLLAFIAKAEQSRQNITSQESYIEWKKKLNDDVSSILNLLYLEKGIISQDIRKTYGYFYDLEDRKRKEDKK
jgi:hypothetical protein